MVEVWWALLTSAGSMGVGYLLKYVLDVVRSKGQFKRDKAHIAKIIYESVTDGKKEQYEERIDRYIEIYENEKLNKVF